MYTSFYKLSLDPFRLTPDPQFFYASQTHNRGLSYLRYAFHQREGFVVITGAPGTGKTELMLNLISGLPREQVVLSKIVTANLHATDLLELVAASYLSPSVATGKGLLLKKLEDFFIAQIRIGKHILLLIDEAHNLSTKALIELSMLSNFQLDARPVLQCFLLGQEPLEQKLEQPELEHLKQRVIASTNLQNLDALETRDYIEHRLKVAGWQGDPLFSDSTYALIYEFTIGVPRRINTVCSRMLLESFLEEKHYIDAEMACRVIEELQEDSLTQHENVPQMSLTLDFSTNKHHTPAKSQLAAPQPQVQPSNAASIKIDALATETSNVIEVSSFNPNASAKHSTHTRLAAAWPMTDVEDSAKTGMNPVSLHHTAMSQHNGINITIHPEAIPDNVHALFRPPLQQDYPDTGDLVVALPVEDFTLMPDPPTQLTSETGEAGVEPFLIDDLAHEQHHILSRLRNDAAQQEEPFSPHSLLSEFHISYTGLILSLTSLMILWWFIYGPGSHYVIEILRVISGWFR